MVKWIDRIAFEVTSAWKRFRILRKCPELRDLEHRLAEARAKHKPTRSIIKRKQQVMLSLLKGGAS